MYRNSEGYSDPTAGAAMGIMMREYREQQKIRWRRQYEMKHRPKIYVASRYAGDVEKNIASAIRYCQYVIRHRGNPIASHLLYPQMLNDQIPEERELGLMFGLALLAVCDEVWCFGDVTGSEGVKLEIAEAKKLGKKIRFMKEAV
ncbi:MAG: DUF4406 domain-containing protein [Clostridium sp.]|nr:DUF4406 domain-containing protein [Clostridium sp.]